jgi:hypothetical protein
LQTAIQFSQQFLLKRLLFLHRNNTLFNNQWVIEEIRRAAGMSQVVECLPGKQKTWSSNPITAKKEEIPRFT